MHYICHDIHILHPQGINIEHETDGVSLFMGYNLQILDFLIPKFMEVWFKMIFPFSKEL